MRVISKKKLREFWAIHPNAQAPLEEWYQVVRRAKWAKFADVRATYRSADPVKQFVVFDIGGNNFRLIAFINYRYRMLYVRRVLTHGEYSQGTWKSDQFGKKTRTEKKKPDGKSKR